MAIVKRLVKGSALTHSELDGNFTDLDTRVTTLENTNSDSQTLTLSGTDLIISNGNTVDLSSLGGGGGGSGLSDVVDDTTPQLGGDLDVNGRIITAASLNVALNPPAGGFLHLGLGTADAHSVMMYDMYKFPKATPSTGDVLTAGANPIELEWAAPAGGSSLSDTDGLSEGSTNLYYTDARVRAAVSGTIGTAGYNSSTGAFSIPGSLTDLGITDGTNGQVLTTNGSGGFTFTTVSGGGSSYADSDVDTHLNTSTATSNEVLSWDGSDYAWIAQSGGGGIALSDLSVTTASASGTPSLSYNNTTGVFTYTPLDLGNAIVSQAQYTTTVTTNAADTSDTSAYIVGNTGLASATGTSTGWVFADIVQDPDNPGTTTILDVDAAIFTGSVVGDITTGTGTQTIQGTVDFTSATSVDFTGVTVNGLSSGGQASRSTVTGTTSSLADAAEADLDITGFKAYTLLTITTDRAARVRLYVNAATRTADAPRAEGTDPTSDAGLIAEVITTGADTVIISPGAYGFNLESTPTTTIPCRVTNKSGSASTVQVDLNILQLEA